MSSALPAQEGAPRDRLEASRGELSCGLTLTGVRFVAEERMADVLSLIHI